MVILTLHRDAPLSVQEIAVLPRGCYPVFGQGDLVAEARLSLPVAHVVRFAATMARAIPDAWLVAEEHPTVQHTAIVEAGRLTSPYMTQLPPLPFRVPRPSPAVVHERDVPSAPGVPPVSWREASAQREVPTPTPTPPPSPPTPTPPPSPSPPTPPSQDSEGSAITRRMDLGELIRQLTPEASQEPLQPSTPPDAPSQIPAEIMAMFHAIRRQEEDTGQVLSFGTDATSAAANTPPTPDVTPALPHPSKPPPTPPAPRCAFWVRMEQGDLEGALQWVAHNGLPVEHRAPLEALLTAADPARVVVGIQVSAQVRWRQAVRLIRRSLHHSEVEVRRSIPKALVDLDAEGVDMDLAVLARDADHTVREAAHRAQRQLQRRSRR